MIQAEIEISLDAQLPAPLKPGDEIAGAAFDRHQRQAECLGLGSHLIRCRSPFGAAEIGVKCNAAVARVPDLIQPGIGGSGRAAAVFAAREIESE